MTDPMIGTELVGRTVTRMLGEGGMGMVYLAEHLRLNLKPYVVKVLHAQHANTPEIVDRMFQEAQTASAIAHPTIVNVIDCGRLPDARPYIVMEYIPGRDLDEHVAQVGARWGHAGRLTVEQAAPLMFQLFDGLRAAHERGIVHRDLKPSNIRVMLDGPTGDAIKILDFGIAKPADDLRVAAPTATHHVFGTPGWMPPEQARGRVTDARADIYSVGVILYVVLTGARPFDGVTAADMLLNQVTVPPVPPHQRVPELPPAISALILECLDVDPERRPRSITEVGVRWINAVPSSLEVAKRVAVTLAERAGHTDPTIRAYAAGAAPVSGAMPANRAWGTTGTPMAGAVGAPTAEPPPSSRRALYGALVALGIAGAGATLAIARFGGDDGTDARAASPPPDAALAPTPSATPPPEAGTPAAPTSPDTSDAAAAVAAVAVDAEPPAPPVDAADSADEPESDPREDEERSRRPGKLSISASPWAEVWVDGKYRGTTPLSLSVPSGRRTVRLKKPDGSTETVRIKIEPGREATISREWD